MLVMADGEITRLMLTSHILTMDGTTGVVVLAWDGMILGCGIVVLDGTIGAGVETSAGIVGIDGITGAGEATVAGAGITGVMVDLALQTLGVLLTDTAMEIKDIMEIEDTHTTQEDVVM